MPSPQPIAIVDDDSSVREALVALLRSHNRAAEGFESAEQFIEAFEPGKYGCVLSDVRMPGMGGLALARWLAEHDSALPVVLMTAHADERMAALAFNTKAVLSKPFACDALSDILRDLTKTA